MPTLLVVDDELSVLSFVGKAMARHGWSVVAADSVDAGIAAARDQAIDVVLCDVIMPDAGGAELTRAMRTSVPVVLMTGHPSVDVFGDDPPPSWWKPVPLLEKPFTMRELTDVLESAVRHRSTR